MINMLKNWIRAVVREDAPRVTYPRQTLGHLKPGQTLTVKNRDGSQDKVTVKGAKAIKPQRKHTSKTWLQKTGKIGENRIQELRAIDAAFDERYKTAVQCGVLDMEILVYEETGGYAKHRRNGLKVWKQSTKKNEHRLYQAAVLDYTRTGKNNRRTITFDTQAERDKSAALRIPLYHEICAEQARKTSKRGWQP